MSLSLRRHRRREVAHRDDVRRDATSAGLHGIARAHRQPQQRGEAQMQRDRQRDGARVVGRAGPHFDLPSGELISDTFCTPAALSWSIAVVTVW